MNVIATKGEMASTRGLAECNASSQRERLPQQTLQAWPRDQGAFEAGPEVACMKVTAEAGRVQRTQLRRHIRLPVTARAADAAAWSFSFRSMHSMNVYKSIGYAVGTPEALALAARLSAWHDAMVAHQRPADTDRVTRCDADCPHAEARSLWHDALETFGEDADQLAFLRRHGAPAITGGAAATAHTVSM